MKYSITLHLFMIHQVNEVLMKHPETTATLNALTCCYLSHSFFFNVFYHLTFKGFLDNCLCHNSVIQKGTLSLNMYLLWHIFAIFAYCIIFFFFFEIKYTTYLKERIVTMIKSIIS